MSETKHSPEPWSWTGRDGEYDLRDSSGNIVLGAYPTVEDEAVLEASDDDIRRLLACVNACAGIPTEALESGALGDALNAAAVYLCDSPDDEADYRSLSNMENALRRLGRLP